MKITGFNPLIVTKDAEAAIKMFEELGFERRHSLDANTGMPRDFMLTSQTFLFRRI